MSSNAHPNFGHGERALLLLTRMHFDLVGTAVLRELAVPTLSVPLSSRALDSSHGVLPSASSPRRVLPALRRIAARPRRRSCCWPGSGACGLRWRMPWRTCAVPRARPCSTALMPVAAYSARAVLCEADRVDARSLAVRQSKDTELSCIARLVLRARTRAGSGDVGRVTESLKALVTSVADETKVRWRAPEARLSAASRTATPFSDPKCLFARYCVSQS